MKEINRNKTIGFIGAGNLGRHAIEKLADEFPLLVNDPFEDQRVIDLGAKYTEIDDLVDRSEIIFLTIKPNKIEEISNQLKNLLSNQLIISFIAGLKFNKLKTLLEGHENIIRAMPTLGISSGSSPIAIYTDLNIDKNHALDVLNILGRCLKIEEEQFDAFTSIFGAGPAFISHLSNILSKIAKEHGFIDPEPWLRDILEGTSYIHKSIESNKFEDIMEMVASKGGVTEAALNKINTEGIEKYKEDAYRGTPRHSVGQMQNSRLQWGVLCSILKRL